jgi:ornithine carbamoyltransferase
MGNSLMIGGCKFGMDVRLCAPGQPVAAEDLVKTCQRDRGGDRARSTLTDGRRRGRRRRRLPLHRRLGVDGRGQSAWDERIRLLKPYQVNAAVLRQSGQPEGEVHALPARLPQPGDRRSASRSSGVRLDGLEVTDEVFESPSSIVFDQAENRLHTIKAVMVATLGD